MSKQQDEESYRKWIGICQQSDKSPLTMNLAGKVVISVKDKVLLELSHEEYASLTANEIVDKLGVIK